MTNRWRALQALLIIPALLCVLAVFSPEAEAAGYDPQAAVNYAHQYALNYNPAYSSWKGRGGDCANFASQCLTAGGLSQDGTWQPYTGAWLGANNLRLYLIARGDCTGYSTVSVNNITIGDLVWSRGEDGTGYGHVMVVTAVSNIGINICGHTNDRNDAYYSVSSMAGSLVYHVHINPAPDPIPPKPVLSVAAGDSMNAVRLSWGATANTDFYSIRFYDAGGNRVYLRDDYYNTAFSALLPAGSYQAEVCAVKRNYYVAESDRVYFSVAQASPTHAAAPVSMSATGNLLYRLYACDGTWLEAKSLAEAAGGRLAILNSQAKQNCVFGLVSEFGHLAFIGAQGYSNYKWLWVDGSAVEGFTAWDANKPDNWQGLENCMVMYPSNGSWEDYPCSDASVKGFVAEFEAVGLTVEPLEDPWLGGADHIRDNLRVSVTYADGSVVQWAGDYTLNVTETDDALLIDVACAGLSGGCQVSTRPDLTGKELVLPAGLTEIGEEAFMGTAAGRVVIPSGCSRIGARAFADCAGLYEVCMPRDIAHIHSTAFAGSGHVTLFVYEDTPAHWYAINYQINYELIPEP